MTTTKLNGTFLQVVYSPKGDVEGSLLRVSGQPVQVVVDKHDEKTAHLVAGLVAGQAIIVSTEDMPPSSKGDGEHPVHAFQKLVSVDGACLQRPPRRAQAIQARSSGSTTPSMARRTATCSTAATSSM